MTATVVCLAVQFFGEAAGVEPAISVENTQLTDSENASIAENATIFISSVQITYKDFPELQNFQASTALAQHAEVLFNVYTSIMGRWGISLNYLLWENPQTLSADSGRNRIIGLRSDSNLQSVDSELDAPIWIHRRL